jgi:hypothetical protein
MFNEFQRTYQKSSGEGGCSQGVLVPTALVVDGA